MTNGVVCEITGKAAAESRQAGYRRDTVTLLEFCDEVERIASVALDDNAAIDDLDVLPPCAETDSRRKTDNRVAAKTLATDNRFEQKAVLPVSEFEAKR